VAIPFGFNRVNKQTNLSGQIIEHVQ